MDGGACKERSVNAAQKAWQWRDGRGICTQMRKGGRTHTQKLVLQLFPIVQGNPWAVVGRRVAGGRGRCGEVRQGPVGEVLLLGVLVVGGVEHVPGHSTHFGGARGYDVSFFFFSRACSGECVLECVGFARSSFVEAEREGERACRSRCGWSDLLASLSNPRSWRARWGAAHVRTGRFRGCRAVCSSRGESESVCMTPNRTCRRNVNDVRWYGWWDVEGGGSSPGLYIRGTATAKDGAGELLRRRDRKIRAHRRPGAEPNKLGRPENRGSWLLGSGVCVGVALAWAWAKAWVCGCGCPAHGSTAQGPASGPATSKIRELRDRNGG